MIEKSFILVLSCLGIAQAVFLCFYLFTLKEGNRLANRFLGLVLLGLTVRIGKSIVYNYIFLEPWIRNLGLSGVLITGPFLWLYGKALFKQLKSFDRPYYLHLIPWIFFVLLSGVIPNRGDFLSYLFFSMIFIHFGIYIGMSWGYLVKISQEAAPKLLQWYRVVVTGVSVIWLLYMGIFVRVIPFYILGAISFSFLVYLFSYLLLKRHVFTLEKYTRSNLDRSTSKKLLQRVKGLFEKEETYLDSNISLKDVAEKLSVPSRDISQAINEHEQKNFSEFVNHYRIEKAKTLLAAPDYRQEKIATVAFDCGFGNVTSFNLTFKAATRMTPSEYRYRFFTV
ncbi:helix-turn-helix transcriptional regulator [Fulvivirga sp. M361]|uniref:helix-turn-helix domain-containing protein n=1 Tax=Fulvivirga sp. M361 TaxID=2594266 RepID=UPI00117B3CA5|nr:helix-turn-helix transcriptional regulator [Fulvivirga sp. M361]TRX62594.1 helix-turn-helix transcriptional regulator [Fulvivirga sp. M361]